MMFKVSAFLRRCCHHWLPALISNTLIKAAPFVNQLFIQMVDVTNLATVHSLLQNAPCRSRNCDPAAWWPVMWSNGVRRLCRQQCIWVQSFCEHGEPWHCLVETWRKVQILSEWLVKDVAVACSGNTNHFIFKIWSIKSALYAQEMKYQRSTLMEKCWSFTKKTVSAHRKQVSSAAGNWTFWPRFVNIENLLNGTIEFLQNLETVIQIHQGLCVFKRSRFALIEAASQTFNMFTFLGHTVYCISFSDRWEWRRLTPEVDHAHDWKSTSVLFDNCKRTCLTVFQELQRQIWWSSVVMWYPSTSHHRLRGSASPVLTATLHSYGSLAWLSDFFPPQP